MYLISSSRRISRQPEVTSPTSFRSETTYTKSAGLNIERSSEPIKNAISATIITVDNGYAGPEERGAVKVATAVWDCSGIAPGGFATLGDGTETVVEPDSDLRSGRDGAVKRVRGFGYELRKPKRPLLVFSGAAPSWEADTSCGVYDTQQLS